MPGDLQTRAEAIAEDVFLGGPPEDFESAGRLQLVTLLEQGLTPGSRVLDVGCGCLRGGYWLIHFLDPGGYFGIEPNRTMLQAGLDNILEPGLAEAKQPRFAHRDDFNLDCFDGLRFDYFLARSIWTHASKSQIEAMLDSFSDASVDRGVLLASYLKARPLGDYKGDKWIGKSHESDASGLVRHSFRWVRETCERRGLKVAELGQHAFNGQRWLRIEAA